MEVIAWHWYSTYTLDTAELVVGRTVAYLHAFLVLKGTILLILPLSLQHINLINIIGIIILMATTTSVLLLHMWHVAVVGVGRLHLVSMYKRLFGSITVQILS